MKFYCLQDESALVSHADLTDFCRKNYKVLKKELDPKHNVADRMYERRIITKTTLESLSEEPCRRTRVDILVKGLVHDSRASVPDIYNKVLAIFHEESLDYLIQCANTKDKSGNVNFYTNSI